MKDSQTLFEQFLESLNDFPNTNLQMHSSLLSDLSGSRLFKKCMKLQAKKCLKLGDGCLFLLEQLSKMNQSAIYLFPSIFHAIGKSADLERVFDYFVDTIIKSNSKFSTLQLDNFNEFIQLFVIDDSRFDLVLEKAEKQFLRSPESILKVIDHIINICGSSFDTSRFLVSKFDYLCNQVKSTNSTVRGDAIALISSLAKFSKDISAMKLVTDNMVQVLAKSNAEIRVVFLSISSYFPKIQEVSLYLIHSLEKLLIKEVNEAALMQLLLVLVEHSGSAFAETEFSFAKVLLEGIKNQKASIRNIYFAICVLLRKLKLNFGSVLPSLSEKMLEAAVDVQSAGIAILDPKKESRTFMEGVSAIAFLTIDTTAKLPEIIQRPDFFLYNQKLYSLFLTNGNDFKIYLQTIFNILSNNSCSYTEVSDSISQTIVRLVINAPSSCYRDQLKLVNQIVLSSRTQMDLVKTLCDSVGIFLLEYSSCNTDEEKYAWPVVKVRSSKSLGVRVADLLQSLLPPPPLSEMFERRLLSMVGLVAHPLVAESVGIDSWVRLCFKFNITPSVILDKYGADQINFWLNNSSNSIDGSLKQILEDVNGMFRQGALNSIFLFTEMMPSMICEILIPQCLPFLTCSNLKNISARDLKIWALPEGEVYENPAFESKRDYPRTADEKWDMELKKELQIKGQKKNVKTSKQEKDLIIQTLKAESERRKLVESVRNGLQLAFDVIEVIVRGISRSLEGLDGKKSFFVYLHSILSSFFSHMYIMEKLRMENDTICDDIILNGSRSVKILRDIYQLFQDCPQQVKVEEIFVCTILSMSLERMGSILLSSKQKQNYPGKVLQSLQEDFSGSKQLIPSDFNFVFPLLKAIIFREDKVLDLTTNSWTEFCILASDLIIFHSGLDGSSAEIPRFEMLQCVIEVLSKFPRLKNAGKDAIAALVMSSANSVEEIIDESSFSSQEDRRVMEIITSTLLDGILRSEAAVRGASISALAYIPHFSAELMRDRDIKLWISLFDQEEISTEARKLWDELHGDSYISKDSITDIIALVEVHEVPSVRVNAAKGLAKLLKFCPQLLSFSLSELFCLYKKKSALPEPKYDQYGMVIPESLDVADFSGERSGIAIALQNIVDVVHDDGLISSVFEFLIFEGEALGDRDSEVQNLMRKAGLDFVEKHGQSNVKNLFGLFDRYLSQPAKASRDQDHIRESVVLFSGTLARHLKPGDRLISEVIEKVVDTLKTPAESVQIAVGECLPGLIRLEPQRAQDLLNTLMYQLFESPSYGERKGAAFGVAGIIKGCGLSSLRNYKVLERLMEALEDKKRITKREGAIFAFESLSVSLGRTFEPYVAKIIPVLLVCFGDSSKEVREATSSTCRTIMASLSAHCIKLILPGILNGLQDRNWRTKTGSIEMLASMSYLAPKQLSQNLPTIIPHLCDALSDTHLKVQESGKQGLHQFGKVIKNPEIQGLVPVLIDALVDPTKHTLTALSAILDTSFSHYIDSPSLALVVPILKRAFNERGIDLKRKCGQIIGNLVTLTDHQDLIPYLSVLLAGLRELLLDPVPEIRAISAKALGILVENLGEVNFPNLVSELLESLKIDNGAVDRSGSAQGLSEVIAGLGIAKLELLLPDIIHYASSSELHIKEGFMTMFIYLPVTHGARFTPYLERIIPSILKGVSDEADAVRAAGMKSALVIINNYSVSAIDLLLPKLEIGVFSENWRNRQNCLQLVGDLLFKLAGYSSKTESSTIIEDDNDSGTETGRKALIEALGETRFFEILSCLYLIRNDSTAAVRQLSLQIWKSIVVNTPKTLKEIMPILIKLVISNLASQNQEKRIIAAKALGDLVQKLGELIIVEIIPILTAGLNSVDSCVRQGVCIGISEILSTDKEELEDFAISYLPLVKKALVDHAPEVREAAAKAFEMLHHLMGSKAIDGIIPDLLNKLTLETDNSLSLAALQELMQVRGNSVLPVLLPKLLSIPITKFNATALGSLIKVSGSSISKRLTNILPSLMSGLEQNDDALPCIEETLGILLSNIYGEDSVHHVMTTLFESIKLGTERTRITVCTALRLLYENSKEDLKAYNADWLTNLIVYLNGKDGENLLLASWGAINAIVKTIKKEDLDKYVVVCQKSLNDAAQVLDESQPIPGFNLPKGLNPILPIFLQGLMFGNSDVRETSAFALGNIVNRTSLEALKPFVIQITGPLIRVIGDKFNPNVKTAILKTLGILLQKAPSMLRPFLPQLQRTFVKSLTETSIVRDTAAKCLSFLIPLQPRLDPLLVELVQTCQSSDDKGIRKALLEAIYNLMKGVKDSNRDFVDSSKIALEKLLLNIIMNAQEGEESLRECGTKCFGIYLSLITVIKSKELLSTSVFRSASLDSNWMYIHSGLLILNNVLEECPKLLIDTNFVDETIKAVVSGISHDKNAISHCSILITSKLLLDKQFQSFGANIFLFEHILNILKDVEKPSDTRRESIITIKKIAKSDHASLDLEKTIPALMACVRDRTIPVKLAAERALVHVLKLNISDEIIQNYVKSLGSTASRSVSDYVRRVLSKIASNESDDEI